MSRVTIPVTDTLSAVVEDHPDQLDLDPELSQARRYALLIEEGAALRNARRVERERRDAYAVHSADPAHREFGEDIFALAVEDGLI
jgi:hypothetical protein